MKKITLLMMTLMFAVMQAWANPINEATARSYVQSLLTEQNDQQSGYETQSTSSTTGGGSIVPELLHSEQSSTNAALQVYHIFNAGNSYYIIAGDDRFGYLLGHGEGTLNMSDIPCGMQFMLDLYKERIDYLLAHPDLVIETPTLNASPTQLPKAIQLLTATWGQKAPFNNFCPIIENQHCLAGCSCTALAQVMYYWQFPTVAPALNALPKTTLDWDSMLQHYTPGLYNTTQAEAVATLMQYVGQAENMNYGVLSSTASTKKIRDAAKNSFHYRYSGNGILCRSSVDNNDAWRDTILAELRADRPVVYVGRSENASHAFVVDGYTTTGLFHINWGWNGNYNGYFSLKDFNPLTLGDEYFSPEDSAYYAFNNNQEIIVGLMPNCHIALSEESLSFSAAQDKTVTQCFTVTGELYEDLNLSLSPENGIFSIDKTTITKAAAACGDTVRVTYSPTEIGESDASITISGSGIEAKTIFLSGMAHEPKPILVTADVDSINFGAVEVGYPVKKTIHLTGNLNENINLRTETRSVNYFSVSPETITPEQAAEGVSVTVTYGPGSHWWNTADLIISSPEIDDLVIPITADPYYPECVNQNQTVFFETNLSQPRLTFQTINVRFFDAQIDPPYPGVTPELMSDGDGTTFNLMPNLDGIDDYSLSLSGDPVFSAMIIKASALDKICTVRITYGPSTPGEHDATLTLHCSRAGVPFVTIPLHGTALAPTPELYPVAEEDVTDTSFDARWKIEYLGSELSSFMIECAPQGSNFDPESTDYHLITDLSPDDCLEPIIPNHGLINFEEKYRCTIDGLQPGTTYCYRVKACFSNEYESEWSNVETVTLPGADLDSPGIHANVKALTFEDIYTGGYETSRTITITGVDLSNDIQLSLANDRLNSYRLSKHTITPEEAATGATVTVYFRADRHIGGIRTATLNIESAGYETVSIPLSGKAIKSDGYITANPGSLSFETHVGTPVTKTFTVHYSKSNGNDIIMISNVNGNDATNDGDGDDADSNGEMLKMKKFEDYRASLLLPHGATVGPGNFSPDWSSLSKSDPFNPDMYISRGLRLQVIGDGCYNITPKTIPNLNNSSISATITVTYDPQSAGSHDAFISITSTGIGATARPLKVPLHGMATDGFLAAPGNGRVTIADVTDLIDLLISGEDLPATADKNGDGQVNITDVTTLIDRMLEQQ